jgi:hypothetical protein
MVTTITRKEVPLHAERHRRATVLDRARPDMIFADPFPHLIIPGALPGPVFETLRDSARCFRDALSSRYKGPNRYHRLSSSELLSGLGGQLPACWEVFIRDHVDPEFFRAGIEVFRPFLGSVRSSVEPKYGHTLEECSVVPRFQQVGDVQLDCQFVHVSPADVPASPLGPHLDREVTLWGGLLYLGEREGGGGGDLALYRFRDPNHREFWRDRSIPGALVRVEKVITAAPNTFVMFLNSRDSVHGVMPRIPGGEGRDLVNFVCEFRHPHFSISPWLVRSDCFAPQ